jgi:hypothetical protein
VAPRSACVSTARNGHNKAGPRAKAARARRQGAAPPSRARTTGPGGPGWLEPAILASCNRYFPWRPNPSGGLAAPRSGVQSARSGGRGAGRPPAKTRRRSVGGGASGCGASSPVGGSGSGGGAGRGRQAGRQAGRHRHTRAQGKCWGGLLCTPPPKKTRGRECKHSAALAGARGRGVGLPRRRGLGPQRASRAGQSAAREGRAGRWPARSGPGGGAHATGGVQGLTQWRSAPQPGCSPRRAAPAARDAARAPTQGAARRRAARRDGGRPLLLGRRQRVARRGRAAPAPPGAGQMGLAWRRGGCGRCRAATGAPEEGQGGTHAHTHTLGACASASSAADARCIRAGAGLQRLLSHRSGRERH